MRRGVYQDLVALIVEPHRRETDPFVQTDQTQSHSDRLIEQPFVLWIEITQARRLLALADRKLALLQAVSNTTKIGYREAFRHRFLHRTRAYAARDQYGRSKQPSKQYLDIVGHAYLVSIGNASSSGVDLSECCEVKPQTSSLGGRTSASAECRHWSGATVRWPRCAILL